MRAKSGRDGDERVTETKEHKTEREKWGVMTVFTHSILTPLCFPSIQSSRMKTDERTSREMAFTLSLLVFFGAAKYISFLRLFFITSNNATLENVHVPTRTAATQ